MTYRDCYITQEGLESYTDEANPEVFRKCLPFAGWGRYWSNTVAEFANAKGLEIHWVFDNCSPEIVVTAGQLKEFLLPIYGPDHPFFIAAMEQLDPARRDVVYGDDF